MASSTAQLLTKSIKEEIQEIEELERQYGTDTCGTLEHLKLKNIPEATAKTDLEIQNALKTTSPIRGQDISGRYYIALKVDSMKDNLTITTVDLIFKKTQQKEWISPQYITCDKGNTWETSEKYNFSDHTIKSILEGMTIRYPIETEFMGKLIKAYTIKMVERKA